MTPSSVHTPISSSTCTESESPTPNPPSEYSGASASDSLVSEPSQSGAEPCTNQQSPSVSPTPITSALSLLLFQRHLPPLIHSLVLMLASAGLISPDLADILATPSPDAAVAKKRTKRIAGAGDLTVNDYAEMLRRVDRRRKEQVEKEKEQRKKGSILRKGTRRKEAATNCYKRTWAWQTFSRAWQGHCRAWQALTKMDSRSMCAAHILRSTQHTCRVHMCKMCTNCTRAYKIRAACICFVCVHIVTMQTYASCMCANCTLYAHFILCTDSRT